VKPYLEKLFTKIGLVEWLKVKALSSSPSTTKKKERERLLTFLWGVLGIEYKALHRQAGVLPLNYRRL
jgi:hypothetical protein